MRIKNNSECLKARSDTHNKDWNAFRSVRVASTERAIAENILRVYVPTSLPRSLKQHGVQFRALALTFISGSVLIVN